MVRVIYSSSTEIVLFRKFVFMLKIFLFIWSNIFSWSRCVSFKSYVLWNKSHIFLDSHSTESKRAERESVWNHPPPDSITKLRACLFTRCRIARSRLSERGSETTFWKSWALVHFFGLHTMGDYESRICRGAFGGFKHNSWETFLGWNVWPLTRLLPF